MKITKVKLSSLIQPEKNIRIHTDQQLKEFERSVNMFGQIRPIVVDENNIILAGNGLYETLVRMGKDTADVIKYDNLTENQKKKLMIADNKIFSLGIENLDTLNSFINELHDDLDIPGFDSEILKQMVSEAEEVTEKLCEYGTLDESEIESIKESGVRKEQQIEKANELQDTVQVESKSAESNNTYITEGPQSIPMQSVKHQEDNPNRKSIICPKCGEIIWL